MRIRRESPVQVKTPAQLDRMREAGLIVARALAAAAAAAVPGVTTSDLDAIAEREIRAAGGIPSFLGYHGYPGTICTSVNDEIVHGIPSPDRRLSAGDLISIDCGAIAGGWHGDAAVTVGVGPVAAAAARLIEDYVGHGIGTEMHMDPPVPNYGKPGRGPVLAEGMALAIEPMLTLGQPAARVRDDGWTVVTADGSCSAHFEHTVAITADGPWVLTAPDGGRAGLARARARQAAGAVSLATGSRSDG
jgi:methionyl aminopeptidase